MYKYGIVVVAYNNISGLKRLLQSINDAVFYRDIDLIISIDYGGDKNVENISREFNYLHGNKIVNTFSANLGLKQHILKCGDLMNKYAWDALVVLEDDLVVSPYFLSYVDANLAKYYTCPDIEGISLYKHEFNIAAKLPFNELDSNSDVFFIQYPMSWGQVWFRDKWNAFIKWYENKTYETMDLTAVPQGMLKWNKSWLKYHILYCIYQNSFFVYPRISYTTNCSDVGEHIKRANAKMQVPMAMDERREFKLPDFEADNTVKYDAFFENMKLPETMGIDSKEVCVSLYGKKEPLPTNKYYLTTRVMNFKRIKSYALMYRPIEVNVIKNVPGEDIFLYDLSAKDKKPRSNDSLIFEYYLKGINIFQKKGRKFILSDFFSRLKGFIFK